MTRNLVLTLLLAVVAVSGTSCFFDVPLDADASVPIDRALLGTWRCLPVGEGPQSRPANFVVTPLDSYRYGILFQQGPEDSERYEGYASSVGEESILNIRVLDHDAFVKEWALARYSFLRSDVLAVQVVDEDLLEDTDQTPDSLRRAFQRLQRQPGLFQDYCVCVNVTDDDHRAAER